MKCISFRYYSDFMLKYQNLLSQTKTGFITNSLLVDLCLSLLTFAFCVYKFWTRKYNYWEKRGVVHMKPSFPLGTIGLQLIKEIDSFGHANHKIYDQFKGERYVGIYNFSEPQLMIRDPELAKQILVRDFNNFINHGVFPELKHDYTSKHLFHLEDDAWKKMRMKLSPTFTSGKMKLMFTLIEVVGQQLSDYLKPFAENNTKVDFKDLISRFNIDVIATCAFGLEVNSLKYPDSEFREIGNLIVNPPTINNLNIQLVILAPILSKLFPIVVTHQKVLNFILNVLKDTIEYRKKNKVDKNDFIGLLMKVKDKTITLDKEDLDSFEAINKTHNTSDEVSELTLEEMAAQMFIFFAAGFETASGTTSFCLFELSKNKHIQDKVRSEIDAVLQRNGEQVTYEALQEMPYMDTCINETLRRYSSVPLLNRKCGKTYQVPDSDLVIEKGMRIIVPTYSIHHDPEYYPLPYKFDPERFSEEATNSRHQYTHLPFGEGQRICIGKRLGLMQVKMGLIAILKDFEVTPFPGLLPDQLPLNPRSFLTVSAIH